MELLFTMEVVMSNRSVDADGLEVNLASSLCARDVVARQHYQTLTQRIDMDEQDIQIRCACGAEFEWTIGEQRFMQGLLEDGKISELRQPKRCKDCRTKKKQLSDRELLGE